MKKLIILLLFPFIINTQNQIINIDGKDFKLSNTNEYILNLEVAEILKPGNLFIAIWKDPLAWKAYNRKNKDVKNKIYVSLKERVGVGVFKRSIKLPEGVYLVSTYLDSNFNNKLDYNFLGIPKEQYGFSNNEISNFRRPKFNEASFELKIDSSLKIRLRSIL